MKAIDKEMILAAILGTAIALGFLLLLSAASDHNQQVDEQERNLLIEHKESQETR